MKKYFLVVVFCMVSIALLAQGIKLNVLTTNAQSSTLTNVIRGMVGAQFNILQYGAVGDGVTDCRTNIQAAIDAAYTAGGGVVYVPKGSFAFGTNGVNASGLILKDNVSLVGVGWDSELLYTYNNAESSVAIGVSGSVGNQTVQDAGNANISIVNLKLRFSTAVDAKGIGISVAGVSGGQIQNVWVDNVGGYSIYLGKNNGTASTEGKYCDTIQVSGCKITRMMDVGVELYGAKHCQVSGLEIIGPGGVASVGYSLMLWGGAAYNEISEVYVEGTGTSNNLSVVLFQPQDETNVLFSATTNNVVSGVLAKNIKQAIKIGTPTVGGKITYGSTVRNCRFYGQTTNAASTTAAQVFNATGIELDNCLFDNFRADGLRVSHTSDLADQGSVTNVILTRCQFKNTGGLNIYGVDNFQCVDGWIFNCLDSVGLKLWGVQYAVVANNRFSDIGNSGNTAGLVVAAGDGTRTRESLYVSVLGNKSDDSRASKFVNWTVQVINASDYVVLAGNNNGGGKAGGTDTIITSTGTHNSLLSSIQSGGFAIQSGDLQLDNNKAIKFLSSGGTIRTILIADSSDNVGFYGTASGSDLKFGPISGTTRMTLKSTGEVGIGSTSPTSKLQVVGLPTYANNAAAVTGGLTAGAFYRTGADPDVVCVVH